MQFDVLTVLPDFFQGPLGQGVLGRAVGAGRITVRIHRLRDYADDPHGKVDDVPYGGGGGMVIKPEPVFRAVEVIRSRDPMEPSRTILLSPQGRRLDQTLARGLTRFRRLILLCGRYEGVDERIREHCAEEEISVGDYILSGGEAAALVLIDVVARLVPGVLGNEESAAKDSFERGMLDAPRYTRPEEYRGFRVPEVLLSGNHERIEAWRRKAALEATKRKRPDLLRAEGKGRRSGTPTGERIPEKPVP